MISKGNMTTDHAQQLIGIAEDGTGCAYCTSNYESHQNYEQLHAAAKELRRLQAENEIMRAEMDFLYDASKRLLKSLEKPEL